MKATLRSEDRTAMKLATMACWWTSKLYPKEQPVWSGIVNELAVMSLFAEQRGDMDEARELARLRSEAERMQMRQFA